jgi:hypothetical protein
MADKEQSDEIPSFRITPKRVDDSWKEEMRREKAAAQPAPPPAAKAPEPAAEKAPSDSAPDMDADEDALHESDANAAAAAGEESLDAAPADAPKPPAPTGTPAEQAQSKIFMQFLGGLAQQALMQLGQMPNPYSGQAELDMKGARYTIELLNVVQLRTKGNLTPDEQRMLAGTLQDLKMAYQEIAAELQRQMAEQALQQAPGGMKPGPGGVIPGPGFGRRR